jgi:hypothetical protein
VYCTDMAGHRRHGSHGPNSPRGIGSPISSSAARSPRSHGVLRCTHRPDQRREDRRRDAAEISARLERCAGDLARNARAVFGSRATSGPRDTRQTVKRPWRRPDRCRRSFCAISPTSWLSSNNCWLSIAQPQPTSHRKPRAGRTVFPRGTAGAASRIPRVLRRFAVLAADAMRRRAPIRQVRGAGGRCVHLRSPPSRGWKSHLVRSRCVRCRSMRRRVRMRFSGVCQSRPARHRATRASRSRPTRPRRARRSRAGS